MSLQHQLRRPRLRIPELHPAVLAPAHHPVPHGRERDTQHEVLVPLERHQTLARARLVALLHAVHPRRHVVEPPHADRLVQAAGHEFLPRRTERDTVHAVLVPLLALRALDQVARRAVPDAHGLVQRAGSDEAVVGRDSDGSHAVLDREAEDALVLLDVPQADRAVARARGDVPAIGSEVQRIDVLLVAGELVADAALGDVPDLVVSACVYVHAQI